MENFQQCSAMEYGLAKQKTDRRYKEHIFKKSQTWVDCFRFLISYPLHLHMSNSHSDDIFKYKKTTSHKSDRERGSFQFREFFSIWSRKINSISSGSKFHFIFLPGRVPLACSLNAMLICWSWHRWVCQISWNYC